MQISLLILKAEEGWCVAEHTIWAQVEAQERLSDVETWNTWWPTSHHSGREVGSAVVESCQCLWLILTCCWNKPCPVIIFPRKTKSHPWLQLLSEGVFKDSDISMAPDEEKHHNWLYDLSSPVALTTNLIIKWTEVVCKLLMSKPVTSLQLEHSWITFYDFICAWM